MAATSSIEWTGATWNPVVGCEAVSPGCAHCYAATMTRRLEAMGQADYTGLTTAKHFNGQIRLLPHKLDIPLKRRKPTTYFVNSMSDLFHEDVPDEFIDRVFAVMALCPQHTFQVLTKRAERMAAYISAAENRVAHVRDLNALEFGTLDCRPLWPLRNVWLGVSCEDQQRADERIPWLLKTPAAVRFISAEPLLGELEIKGFMHDSICFETLDDIGCICSEPREVHLDWVIVGGESGPGARPMRLEWAQSIVEQCKDAAVPCFVKQLGAKPINFNGEPLRYEDRKGGDIETWPSNLRVRELPCTSVSA